MKFLTVRHVHLPDLWSCTLLKRMVTEGAVKQTDNVAAIKNEQDSINVSAMAASHISDLSTQKEINSQQQMRITELEIILAQNLSELQSSATELKALRTEVGIIRDTNKHLTSSLVEVQLSIKENRVVEKAKEV
jgi:hypothetical protein